MTHTGLSNGVKERCEKIKTFGRAGISSKFYKCGRLEGEGNKAFQVITIIEVFGC
jgi:hypothetical protein